MMATVPHVTFGLGLRKFQADGFLLTRVYSTSKITWRNANTSWQTKNVVVNKCNWVSYGWIRVVHISALKSTKAFVIEMRVESQT